MAIYDNNWSSYAYYCTAFVESSFTWNAVEKVKPDAKGQGIGITQWTNGRAYDLLKLLITDYPSFRDKLPSLISELDGPRWEGVKLFGTTQANEIREVLKTTEGIATQNKLWAQDVVGYIELLKPSFSDPKTAIFALTVHHQSPRAYGQILNATGDVDLETYYKAVNNNSIVGQGRFPNRQPGVKKLLDEWDGESGKEGYGDFEPNQELGLDENPNYGNPEDTETSVQSNLIVNYIKRQHDTLLLNVYENGVNKNILFYKGNGGLFYPKSKKYTSEATTETEPLPTTPEQTSPEAPQQIEDISNFLISILGTLSYTQGGNRLKIEEGWADCSSLMYYCFKRFANINIGTATVTQIDNGKLLYEGHPDNLDYNSIRKGDLIFNTRQGSNHSSRGYVGHVAFWNADGDILHMPGNKSPKKVNAIDYYKNDVKYRDGIPKIWVKRMLE